MNAILQPLFWRLANEQNSDLDVVSVLMPRGEEADKVAIEYAIDVSFKPSIYHQIRLICAGLKKIVRYS